MKKFFNSKHKKINVNAFSDEQSWDYEQFIQFFVIMNEMVEKMAVNLNTINKNENMNAVVS